MKHHRDGVKNGEENWEWVNLGCLRTRRHWEVLSSSRSRYIYIYVYILCVTKLEVRNVHLFLASFPVENRHSNHSYGQGNTAAPCPPTKATCPRGKHRRRGTDYFVQRKPSTSAMFDYQRGVHQFFSIHSQCWWSNFNLWMVKYPVHRVWWSSHSRAPQQLLAQRETSGDLRFSRRNALHLTKAP